MLRGGIFSIPVLIRHGLLFLLLHYSVVGFDESEVDIVGVFVLSDVATYDVLLLKLDVVDGYAMLLMDRILLLFVFIIVVHANVKLSVIYAS